MANFLQDAQNRKQLEDYLDASERLDPFKGLPKTGASAFEENLRKQLQQAAQQAAERRGGQTAKTGQTGTKTPSSPSTSAKTGQASVNYEDPLADYRANQNRGRYSRTGYKEDAGGTGTEDIGYELGVPIVNSGPGFVSGANLAMQDPVALWRMNHADENVMGEEKPAPGNLQDTSTQAGNTDDTAWNPFQGIIDSYSDLAHRISQTPEEREQERQAKAKAQQEQEQQQKQNDLQSAQEEARKLIEEYAGDDGVSSRANLVDNPILAVDPQDEARPLTYKEWQQSMNEGIDSMPGFLQNTATGLANDVEGVVNKAAEGVDPATLARIEEIRNDPSIDPRVKNELIQGLYMSTVPGQMASLMTSPAAAAADENAPVEPELTDAEGNALDITDENAFDVEMAILAEKYAERGEEFTPYEDMWDFMQNGTYEDWHDVVFDPRVSGHFVSNLGTYVTPEEAEQLMNGYAQIADDDTVNEIAERAYQAAWDAQKQLLFNDLVLGTAEGYSDEMFNRIFGDTAYDPQLREYAVANGLFPGTVYFDRYGNPYPTGLTMYDTAVPEGLDLDMDELADLSVISSDLFDRYMDFKDDASTTVTDEDEAYEALGDLFAYNIGLRRLNDSDELAAERVQQGGGQDYINKMFVLDPHDYVLPETLASGELNQALNDHQIWDIEEGPTFEEQNPYWYTPEGGGMMVDANAYQRDYVPLSGLDQALAAIGAKQADPGIVNPYRVGEGRW